MKRHGGFTLIPIVAVLAGFSLFLAMARSGAIQPYGVFHVRGVLEQRGHPALSDNVPQVMVWGVKTREGYFYYLSHDHKPVSSLPSSFTAGKQVYAKGPMWVARDTLGKTLVFLEYETLDLTGSSEPTDDPAKTNPVIDFVWGIKADSED